MTPKSEASEAAAAAQEASHSPAVARLKHGTVAPPGDIPDAVS